MKRLAISTLAAVGLLFAVAGASSAPATAAAAPRMTVAQAEAWDAQHPPAMMGGRYAVMGKVALSTASRAPIMSRKGYPRAGAAKALTGCAPSCYKYGVGKQGGSGAAAINTQGVSDLMGIFNPTLGPKAYHSLGEIAVQSADEQQIVEVGWTVDNTGVCPTTTQACFFIYSWRNGVGMGYNGGNGWVPYSGRPITPGDSLNSAVNTEKVFAIQWNPPTAPATTGKWWIGYGPSGSAGWVGSFPESSWTTGAGAIASFNHGDLIQVFGETVQSVDAPCAMMGNGTVGNAATGGAAPAAGPARIASTTFFNGPTVNLSIGSTTAAQPVGNLTSTHKTFTYGGPAQTTSPC